ncbi:MAG: substrate-binding domain-containing protein, partial [Pirellulales bacterium]|nr:substrate-binding domain-containing protein [Pirellulales bacterium]
AEVAVDHFVQRGLRHLAFCGEVSFNWACWRRDAFLQRCRERGLCVESIDITDRTGWGRQRPRIVRWLRGLPNPCGLMAAYDSLARRLVDLCREAGRSVPDSIAVLGVDDDPLLCQLASPPLTSIIPDAQRAGYVAAELLDKMMSGHAVPPAGTLLPPLGIVTRRSTDTMAIDDEDVELAARYILQHACDGIQVTDVVAITKLTRRVLELRFKAAIGKTPHQMIIDTRLTKAELLLRETTLPLDRIADRCGIEYPEYLSVLFRKHRGTTPGQYRKAHRENPART